ncbi:MAG: TlpA family protein disulfide reductase [Actinobacteria bacterium]|nr:TlpA family protein disulfide reductase [Actinomycetota bacterium]
MRRLLISAVLLSGFAAACGGNGGASTSPTLSATTTATAETTTTAAPGTTVTAGAAVAATTTEPRGPAAPDFTLALADGGEFRLGDEDRPVLLVFWAEWCGICEREMPVLDAVAADYQGSVVFVAVAGRSTPEASALRAGEWFSPDRMLWGYDDGLWGAYGILGQPTTVLITGDDRVAGGWAGPRAAGDIRAELDALVTLGG